MAVISSARLSTSVESDRLDAEFFDPDDLKLIRRLGLAGGQPLGAVASVFHGRTPTAYLEDGGVPVVRSGDLSAPFIYPSCPRPFLRAAPRDDLVRLAPGDVLVSSIGLGAIGKISLVMDPGLFVTVSEVSIVRPHPSYAPEVLFAYLTTQAGQRQILRQVTGATGQQHLLKSKLQTVLVPAIPRKATVGAIKMACRRAWELEMEATQQQLRIHSLFAKATGLDP